MGSATSTPTAPSVRAAVWAAPSAILPSELTRWAAEHSTRLIARARISEAVAASRDATAALLIVDWRVLDEGPEQLMELLGHATRELRVLCVGPADWRERCLESGISAYVDSSAGWTKTLSEASRLIESHSDAQKGSSGIRRTAKSVIQVGPIVIELSRRRVFVHEEALKLRPAEFEVLVLLALNKERPVSASEIVHHALATHGDGSSARNQLFELRRKLRDVGLHDAIKTVRNQGYQLVLR